MRHKLEEITLTNFWSSILGLHIQEDSKREAGIKSYKGVDVRMVNL